MAAKKPSAKPSAKKTAAPVPQKHGGVLVPGAGGGPQPGSGRPPSAIREQLRGSFEARIALLEQFADGTLVAETGDRLKAIDMLAKYGLGTMKEVSVETVREKVRATLDVISKHVSRDQNAAIVSEMKAVWA